MTGPAGPASSVPGPTGPAGAASTVPGPAGPAGAASTVPGPTGPAGPTGTYVPPPPRVITDSNPVAVAPSDGLIIINKTTGGPTSVAFEPNPVNGAEHRVKDGKGDADVNPITMTWAGGNIDGQSSAVINRPKAAISFEFGNGQWNIV